MSVVVEDNVVKAVEVEVTVDVERVDVVDNIRAVS